MKGLLLHCKKELPGEVDIALPASKSISNRILVMEALSGGKVQGLNHSTADDTQLLGAALQSTDGALWLGHAGTALRFGLAWACVSPGTRVLRGSQRLSERPIAPLVDALRQLGALITYAEKEGFAPLKVEGKALEGGSLKLDAGLSSQFITALMLIGPYLKGGLTLELKGDMVSRPYLEMTAALMTEAGAHIHFDDQTIRIAEGTYRACRIKVEPDWSAASYFYSAAALMPGLKLHLNGLQAHSLQGDAFVAKLYEAFGVQTQHTESGAWIKAEKGYTKAPASIDFLNCPDLAQTVAVTSAGLQCPLQLIGLKTLRVKETDRIAALATELSKCGTQTSSTADTLSLRAFDASAYPLSEHVEPPAIATYHDHRMAMAFAPLVLKLGRLSILDPGVVSKSFPDYWEQMGKLIAVSP